MDKPKVAMILFLIGGIIMAISLVQPWYYRVIDSDAGLTGRSFYTWTEVEVELSGFPTQTESYEDLEWDNIASVFQMTMIFAVMATIFSFLGFLLILLKRRGSLGLGTPIIMIVVLLGFLFAIIAPVYLMTNLPAAIKEDEFGEGVEDDIGWSEDFSGEKDLEEQPPPIGQQTARWGGSVGFMAAWLAGILNLIGFLLFFLGRNDLF